MTISRRACRLSLVLLLLALPAIGAMAQIPLLDYEQALCSIPVSNSDYILSAIDMGMMQEEFPAEPLLRLIERLAAHAAPAFEKEAILIILAHTMKDGLPIDGLISRASEGLARGVPLQQIEQGIAQRLILLRETRDLLYAKGVFSAPAGAPQTMANAIPTPRFNQLLIHISEALGEFLEGGGSPFEGHLLYQEVHNRLIMLQGVTLLVEDVELILDRIEAEDLTQVALAAVS